MILQSLCEYYDRRKDSLPPHGREEKEIGFLIVISKDGQFVRLEDQRKDPKRSRTFIVKKHVERTSAAVANLLYDNSEYVLRFSNKKDASKSRLCNELFVAKIEALHKKAPNNADLDAIVKFYATDADVRLEEIKKDPLWPEVEKNLDKKFSFFSFLIEGDDKIVAEKEELIALSEEETAGKEGMCLVSGERDKIVTTTAATMIAGSQATAKLVAFQINSGYDSYGKTQGGNAPVGERAEFKYTTALNHLLSADSHNKFRCGGRTFVFWASKVDEACREAEDNIWTLFGFNEKTDDPDAGIVQVKKVFDAIHSGVLQTSLDDKFHILGLAPNSARIAVTYWAVVPLKEFAAKILGHFDDMEICGARPQDAGLYSIMKSISSKGGETSPNLSEAVVSSIFQGTPYPATLFASCIRRIRAEQDVGRVRAAIIKAYLNRLNDNETKIKVMLDKENRNQGYLCGRLFAAFDKTQDEANKQHSIRERYMNAASATPASVFPTVMNLSSHHAEKLPEDRRIFFEKLKQEIIDKIEADGFPAHLELQDQGRFFVGYYHQLKDFYTKKTEETVEP